MKYTALYKQSDSDLQVYVITDVNSNPVYCTSVEDTVKLVQACSVTNDVSKYCIVRILTDWMAPK